MNLESLSPFLLLTIVAVTALLTFLITNLIHKNKSILSKRLIANLERENNSLLNELHQERDLLKNIR